MLPRLVQFAAEPSDLRFLAGSGLTDPSSRLWGAAALYQPWLAASRLYRCTICAGTASHCLPQAMGGADEANDAITAGICDRRNGVRLSFCVATILKIEWSALGSLADIEAHPPYVRFTPKAEWISTIAMYSCGAAWVYSARLYTSSAFPPDVVRATPKVKSSPASLIIDHF